MDVRHRGLSLREQADTEANPAARIRDELQRRAGAALIGRTMFDVGEEPWGADPPFAMCAFVITSRPREAETKQGGTTYTFVTDGIEAALGQARAAAGDKDVLVVGGANVARQYLEAGLLDEFQVHLVPILLGDGVRLFEGIGQVTLKPPRVVEDLTVTHLKYSVVA